jgi:GDP-L-fucose synthase
MMNKKSSIYITGDTGLVGSAIIRELKRRNYDHLLFAEHDIYDLRQQQAVRYFFMKHKPEYVFHCAAHAGGIKEAINYPADMLFDNMMINMNVINAARMTGVKKLINLGSSCIYPVNGKQPYKETQIGKGKTDENWTYAIAKIAGIELCRAYHKQYGNNFISLIPCNLYGINDNFDYDKAHVIPALIRKFTEAKKSKSIYVSLWGNGESKREFMYVDDFAWACVEVMEKVDYDDIDGIMNVGTGYDVSIMMLARLIQRIIYPEAVILRSFDGPNGIPSKLMDVSRMKKALNWIPSTTLKEGITSVYEWYQHSAYCQPV